VLRSRRSQQDGTEGEMLRRGGTLAATATTPVAGAPEAPEKRAAAAGAPRSAADASMLSSRAPRPVTGRHSSSSWNDGSTGPSGEVVRQGFDLAAKLVEPGHPTPRWAQNGCPAPSGWSREGDSNSE
jgi:hypothetical protein